MKILNSKGGTLMHLSDDANGQDLVMINDNWYRLDEVYQDKKLLRAFNDSVQSEERSRPHKPVDYSIFSQSRNDVR